MDKVSNLLLRLRSKPALPPQIRLGFPSRGTRRGFLLSQTSGAPALGPRRGRVGASVGWGVGGAILTMNKTGRRLESRVRGDWGRPHNRDPNLNLQCGTAPRRSRTRRAVLEMRVPRGNRSARPPSLHSLPLRPGGAQRPLSRLNRRSRVYTRALSRRSKGSQRAAAPIPRETSHRSETRECEIG